MTFSKERSPNYYRETGGKVRQSCDLSIRLTVTSFVGDCEDCDYAWDIEADLVRDDSLVTCTPNPFYSYIPNGSVGNPALVFWDARRDFWGYDDDVLATSYAYDLSSAGGAYLPGPYFHIIASDSAYDDPAVRDGATISWGEADARSGSYGTTNYWSYYVGYNGTGHASDDGAGMNYGGYGYGGELGRVGSSYAMDG